ncbi:MAG: MBL fold metallo-hydrolase [Nitrososphaerota archaeon]|nr:MBL fold metallo-hydrolase [Nitrososphaerota archaeon]
MVEILEGVHEVDGVNANSYLVIESDGSLTLVDAGMSSSGKKVLDYVRTNLSKQPSDLKTIVLTHAHMDHARGALAIKKATGAKVAIHELDADYLSGKRKLPTPGGAMGFAFRFLSVFFRSPTVEPDIRLKEYDRIGASLEVLHTPGHKGSIALYDRGRKLMFVGDAITNRRGKLQGPPRQFTVEPKEAEASIEKISAVDFEVMLSGHGDPVKSGAAKKVRELYASLKK